jgi:hypothetical protein
MIIRNDLIGLRDDDCWAADRKVDTALRKAKLNNDTSIVFVVSDGHIVLPPGSPLADIETVNPEYVTSWLVSRLVGAGYIVDSTKKLIEYHQGSYHDRMFVSGYVYYITIDW